MRKRKIFISYSRKDAVYLDALHIQLKGLKRSGLIEYWSNNMIIPGKSFQAEVKREIELADIIIFLVSPDFIASDYLYDIEISKAIERHENGEIVIVPIIIRYCDFQLLPISKFQALPKNAKPISTWGNEDEAWLNVLEGIKKIIVPSDNTSYKISNKKRKPKKFIFSFRVTLFFGFAVIMFLLVNSNFNKVWIGETKNIAKNNEYLIDEKKKMPIKETAKPKHEEIVSENRKDDLPLELSQIKSTENMSDLVSENSRKNKNLSCNQNGSVKLNNQPAVGATIIFDDNADLTCTVNENGKFSIKLPNYMKGKQIQLTIEYDNHQYPLNKIICYNRLDIRLK